MEASLGVALELIAKQIDCKTLIAKQGRTLARGKAA
jgi:hypothetical protein